MSLKPRPYSNQPGAYFAVGVDKTLSVLADYAALQNVTAASTITLPDAAAAGQGWRVCVRHGGGDVTIVPAGVDTIEMGRDTALTSILLSTQGDEVEFLSTGSGWIAYDRTIHVFAHMYSGVAQSIPTGTNTRVNWPGSNDDTHAAWDAVNFEYVCAYAGEYWVSSVLDWDTPSTFDASIKLFRDNGTPYEISGDGRLIQSDAAGNTFRSMRAEGHITCAKGDKLYVEVWHNQGGNVNIHDSGNVARNFFDVRRVGG